MGRNQNKKIFINGRFLEQPLTGVQRYTRELLTTIDSLISAGEIALPENLEIICLAPNTIVEDPLWENIRLKKVGNLRHNFWEQIELPYYAKGQLLFSPANIGPFLEKNQVTTIHDASVFAVPEAYSFSFRLKYKVIFHRMAKIARKIITDSEYSKKEICKYLSVEPQKIAVIPLGHEHLLDSPIAHDYLQKKGIGHKPFLLCVGSSSVHKNLKIVFKAVEILKRDDYEVIIAGGNFSKVFQDQKILDLPNVRHLGYVDDSELCVLYRSAKAFIFPSKYEGFGLPILESLAFGCPVITTREASIPEVGRDMVTYFDWDNPNQLADIMNKTLDGKIPPLEKASLIKHLSLFTWKKCATETFDILMRETTGKTN